MALAVLAVGAAAVMTVVLVQTNREHVAMAQAIAAAEHERHKDYCYQAFNTYGQQVADRWAAMSAADQIIALQTKSASPTPPPSWVWALGLDPAKIPHRRAR